jgi:hypothetical protein
VRSGRKHAAIQWELANRGLRQQPSSERCNGHPHAGIYMGNNLQFAGRTLWRKRDGRPRVIVLEL